jgi:hypothetical protein
MARSEDHAAQAFQQSLSLLSLLLKGDHDAAAYRLQQGAVPVDDFARFVARHQLQCTVFSLLEGSSGRPSFPQHWVDQLRTLSLRQRARQETLVCELVQLSALLTSAGQEFILLKGPYLAERFFGGIERRTFWDLDMLIRREHLAAVEHLLRRAGYVRRSTVLLHTALTTRFTHAFDFAKSSVTLDLHWRLSSQAAHDLDDDAIWWQRQAFVLRGQHVCVLSDEYDLVFNLISIFKDMERGSARLKPFVDLYFILRTVSRGLDWDAFVEQRQREQILGIVANVLALFLDFFKAWDTFPEVAAVVARQQGRLKVMLANDQRALLEASPGALRNKVWAAGLYDCSRLRVFAWWLVSLPFRLAVYHPGKGARFKRWLQQLKDRGWASLQRRTGGSAGSLPPTR